MKVGIIGSRTFSDYSVLCKTMDRYFAEDYNELGSPFTYFIDEAVSGGANGADKLGAQWAKEHGIKLTEFVPDWERFGKRAGFIRNEDIVRSADVIVCFWDGVSKGSANSLSIAKRLKKTSIIVYF